MLNFNIREYELNMAEILSLYESVGWTNYTKNPEMLKKAYENSLRILGAYDGEKLCGVLRAVGDGFTIIYIQDLLIFPQFQGMGIGKALVSAINELYENVYQKVLLTDNQDKTVSFYENCGFKKSQDFNCVSFVKFN